MNNKEIYGVIAWITENGITTSKVIPLQPQQFGPQPDSVTYYSQEHEERVYHLGEHWVNGLGRVTFASEDRKEAELWYNGLAAGAALFATWRKKKNNEPEVEK